MGRCNLQCNVYPGITQFRLKWLFRFNSIGTGDVVQWVKALAPKPNDPSSVPRTQMEGRKN